MAISNGNNTLSAVASINGYVAKYVRGDNGFGFDEMFELEICKTLAELALEGQGFGDLLRVRFGGVCLEC